MAGSRTYNTQRRFLLTLLALVFACGATLAEATDEAKRLTDTDDLVSAAKAGDVAAVQALIASGIDTNQPDGQENVALIQASANGHLEVVKMLLAAGARTDQKVRSGFTALSEAAANGHLSVVRALIEAGADVSSSDNGRSAPLLRSVRSGHREIARTLLNAGADITVADNEGWQALHLLASYRERPDFKSGSAIAMAYLLLEQGADIDGVTEVGETPLHIAARYGKALLTQFLVDKGAEINAETVYGVRPLDMAWAMRHMEVFHMLREAGATTGSYHERFGTTNCPPLREVYPGKEEYDPRSPTATANTIRAKVYSDMARESQFGGGGYTVKLRGMDIAYDENGRMVKVKCYNN